MSRKVRLFTYRVTKLQRAWRRVSLVLHAQARGATAPEERADQRPSCAPSLIRPGAVLAQLELNMLAWSANDFRVKKKGDGEDFGTLTLLQIKEVRGEVAAEDLARRRLDHVRRVRRPAPPPRSSARSR